MFLLLPCLAPLNQTLNRFPHQYVYFACTGVNTIIEQECATKQPDWDLFEEVVSVRLQTNFGTGCLCYECDSILICHNFNKK